MRAPGTLRLVVALVAIVGVTGGLAALVLTQLGHHRKAGSPQALTVVVGPDGTTTAAPTVPEVVPTVPAPPATSPSTPAPPTPRTGTTVPETTTPTVPGPLPAPLADPLRAACFGAAAADTEHPCDNPRLAGTVYPTPTTAEAAQHGEGCRRSFDRKLLRICFWGSTARAATRTIALIGDSHASHWRAALQTVVQAKHWRAISISRAGCPLTLADPDLPGEGRRVLCKVWNRQVQRWVAAHPSIDAIFTGAHRIKVVPPRGQTPAEARLLGYTKAWRRLIAAGVQHIVVFRDTPRSTGATLQCVTAAVEARRAAGTGCALPRRVALPADPFSEAARRFGSSHVQVLDMSRFFCGPTVCPPVIGGALVLRDVSHMTTTYSRTLGPYLLDVVDRLTRRWRGVSAIRR